jgi:uncharacterized protein
VAATGDYLADEEAGRWQVFFRVADVDATLTRIIKLGGAVLRQPRNTPFGRLAEVADPTGARFNLAS